MRGHALVLCASFGSFHRLCSYRYHRRRCCPSASWSRRRMLLDHKRTCGHSDARVGEGIIQRVVVDHLGSAGRGMHQINPIPPATMTMMATVTMAVSPDDRPPSSSVPPAEAPAALGTTAARTGQPLCMSAQSHARICALSSHARVAAFHTHGRYTLLCEKKEPSHRPALSYCVAHMRL